MALARFLEPTKNLTYSSSKVTCRLKSLDPKYKDIELSTSKTTNVGRSEATQISDTFCSKSQLLFEVNLEKLSVQIQVKGTNASGFNGYMLEEGGIQTGYHEDKIEILYGKYPYRIEFIPPPTKKFKKDMNLPEQQESYDLNIHNNLQKEETFNFDKGTWNIVDDNKLIIYTNPNIKSSDKIAAYDLDWTIIKTKSGNVFPKDTNDWEIMLSEIPGKLKNLHKNGYKLCFFTNQSGIGRGKCTIADFQFRIKSILTKLQLPIQVFISTTYGKYRKPIPGMWNYLENNMNDNIKIIKEQSFYVGDAAGRPETKTPIKKKRDHSAVDRLFAINIGISFYTPEEHFQNKTKAEWKQPEFNPKEICNLKLFEPADTQIPSENCEIILMVGLPGSGKSKFVESNLKNLGYIILNADTVGNVQACLTACEKNCNLKKSCVIDNTNLDIESRKKFINLAKKNSIPIRCFVMNISLAHIQHNLIYRDLTDTKHSKINEMILNTMKKKYVLPTLSEGFTEVIKVNFVGDFQTEEEENLYKMYLSGK